MFGALKQNMYTYIYFMITCDVSDMYTMNRDVPNAGMFRFNRFGC